MEHVNAGKKRQRVVAAEGEGEADYERAPRQNRPEWMHHGRSRLPIKTADGAVAANPVKRTAGTRQVPEEEPEESAGEDSGSDHEDDKEEERPGRRSAPGPAPPPTLSFSALSAMPTAAVLERRAGLKATIASLASTIISSPERSIAERSRADDEAPKPSKAEGAPFRPRAPTVTPLQQLQLLCGDADPVVRKLAMLSSVAVFRDVAPGYRVRLPTTAEVSARVRKDVRRLRAFEAALLTGYQRFLKDLEVTATYGEAAGYRLHLAGSGGGGDDAAAAAARGGGASRFDTDRSAADRGDGGLDDDGAGGGGVGATGSVTQKDWNAQKMAEKRQRIALRDSTAAYDADDETLRGLGLTALHCMAELLASLSHFNFHANVAGFLVARAVTGADAEAVGIACGALRALFSGDAGGEATALAVQSMAAAIKAAAERPGGLRRVRPEALSALLHFRVNALEVGRAGGAGGREFALQQGPRGKKAKRKAAGTKGGKDPFDEADVLAGLKAADAESLGERRRFAAAALKHAVAIFFRILKAPGHSEALLSPVLGGLARVAHLIDVSVVSDLIRCLRALLVSSARGGGGEGADGGAAGAGAPHLRLDVGAALHCVLAALQIMDGPGELLNADEADFARFLYASLLRLAEPARGGGGGDHAAHSALAAKTISALLLRRREYSAERIAAFALRAVQVALALPQHAALALIAVARALLARYPAAASILAPPAELVRGGRASALQAFLRAEAVALQQPQHQRAGATATAAATASPLSSAAAQAAAATGISPAERAFMFDCDRAGSLSQTAWPLALLSSHYHPKVAATAAAALRQAPLLPSEGADALFREFDPSAGAFNPPPALPQRHPFAVRLAAAEAEVSAAAAAAGGGGGGPGVALKRKQRRRSSRQPQFLFVSAPPLAPYLARLAGSMRADEEGGEGESPAAWQEGAAGGVPDCDERLAAGLAAHCEAARAGLAARCGAVVERARERLADRRQQQAAAGGGGATG